MIEAFQTTNSWARIVIFKVTRTRLNINSVGILGLVLTIRCFQSFYFKCLIFHSSYVNLIFHRFFLQNFPILVGADTQQIPWRMLSDILIILFEIIIIFLMLD